MTRGRAFALAVVVAVACVAAGCGGHRSAHGGAPTAQQATAVAHGCLDVAGKTRHVRFSAPGERLDATVVGTGSVGVVLANQTENVACQWSPLPQYLAARGYRVLAFDYGNGDQSAEVQAAARYLGADGARPLALIGASIGGAVVIDAAVHLHPAPAAVVSLSGVPEVTSYPFPRDARLLQSPVFQIGGTEDPVTQEGKDTRAMYRASRSPGSSSCSCPE